MDGAIRIETTKGVRSYTAGDVSVRMLGN